MSNIIILYLTNIPAFVILLFHSKIFSRFHLPGCFLHKYHTSLSWVRLGLLLMIFQMSDFAWQKTQKV
ncbi:unnamed protein product [Schistosoma bovis]|nr:unnamed protein product [Schistosoma bovis]